MSSQAQIEFSEGREKNYQSTIQHFRLSLPPGSISALVGAPYHDPQFVQDNPFQSHNLLNFVLTQTSSKAHGALRWGGVPAQAPIAAHIHPRDRIFEPEG
jgi:hypothetical protein